MPSEVFEDVIEIPIGLLDADSLPLDCATSSYPFPMLRPQGRVEARTFPTVVLENPFLRVVILPSLGGRVLSLYDKRTETELLPGGERLIPVSGTPRGQFLPAGIEWTLSSDSRPNSMGRVAIAAEPAEEEGDSAVVWMAETAMANGLGMHIRLALPPDAARLDIRFRVQNRTFASVPYHGGLLLHSAGHWDQLMYRSPQGIFVFASDTWTPLEGCPVADRIAKVQRSGSGQTLGPRQTDMWEVSLTPFGVSGDQVNGDDTTAVAFGNTRLVALTTEDRPGHKLVLQTTTGQVLEAPVNLQAQVPLEIPLDDLPAPAVAVVLLDGSGEERLRIPGQPSEVVAPPTVGEPSLLTVPTDRAQLLQATQDPALRGPAWARLAALAVDASDWTGADYALEQALLYNGDDALAWWAKAAVKRLQGSEEEPVESLNAHYLTPLEPALRAEAFLGMPTAQGHDPSPVVAPLAEIPEDLIEVAGLLIELGALESAGRWIDESLRHHDLAMLRYLMADLLLTGPKLDVEAAEHVAKAAQSLVPPLPWRDVELAALRRLHGRFPHDASLARLLALAELNLS